MKPQRPDSAKSIKTRITIDSEITSNNLNNSKFSQTFSQGVKVNNDKNIDFHKYVHEKNKDPKFKKFLQTNLPEIPEQLKPSTQLSKLTSKPFQKKISKIEKEKSEKKVEEVQKKIQQQPKVVKKQNLQSSKTFMDKSKQKMKLQSKQQGQELQSNSRIQQKNQKLQNQVKQNSNVNKVKINLNGFVLNIPGKAPQVIKQQKAEQNIKDNKENEQKKQRDKLMTQISEFVSQVQQRNADYLPNRYDQFIDKNIDNRDFDIEKININDFLEEPNEKDYSNLMKKINDNERKLQNNDKKVPIKSNSSISINLQQIIDDNTSKKQQQQDKPDDNSVIMSSMTASDVKDRNMFLTQILKGRRLTEQQLCQIKQNNDAMVKLIKLQDNKDDYLNDDQIQITQINMTKKKNNRIMERNKIQAAGDYYRQCDYLTPEEQQRIQDLINGVHIQSPFQFSDIQALTNRRIDEGIIIHRKLCKDIEGTEFQEQDIRIEEETLPKDPILRKKAQLKILRQKINSVNWRLSNLNDVVVNKNKLQNLVNKYKQTVRPSKLSESIINEKNKQIEGQCQKLRQAQQILTKAENQKQQILHTLQDLASQFSNMYQEIIRMQNMDIDQLRKLQQEKLNQKKKQIYKVQKEAKQFQSQLDNILEANQQLKKKIEFLDRIMTVNIDIPKCEGYQQGETIQDLDQLVTRKWQAAEEAVQNIRNQEC